MKSVVLMAYWFPPEGNAAVYRPLRFLRNLPAYGWQGRVICADAFHERHDAALARQVPEGTEVVRVAGEDLWQSFQRRRAQRLRAAAAVADAERRTAALPSVTSRPTTPRAVGGHAPAARESATLRARARALVRNVESWWYHPDFQRPWVRPATAATLAMCVRQRPDALWVTGPPFSAFVAAARVSEQTGIPYVLDFRTSWTIVPSPFEAMRPWWAQRRDRRLLRALFADAQAVVFFYEAEAECFWRLYRDVLDVGRIHVIPNGFDGEVEPYVHVDSPRFTILYTGTLADYGYEGFLEAVAAFIRRDPARTHRVSVQFVGEQESSLVDRVATLGLGDVVSTRPPVSHAAVAALQRSAHVLLMLERRASHEGHELLAGAKLFGYLQAGKPILGAVPRGEAERVLREVGVRTIAPAESVDAIGRVLESMFNHWCAGTLGQLVPDPAACAHYSGRAQTGALVRALEGRPALQPFVPGVVEIVPSLKSKIIATGWA